MSDATIDLSTAARRYRISQRRLLRLVRSGALVGVKAPKNGDPASMRIPTQSLERLGYRPGPTTLTERLSTPGRGSLIVGVALALAFAALAATLVLSDDPAGAPGPDVAWEQVEARTEPGDIVAVVGSGLVGAVPPGRAELQVWSVADLGDADVALALVGIRPDPGALAALGGSEVSRFTRDGVLVRVFDPDASTAGDPSDGDDAPTPPATAGPVAPDDGEVAAPDQDGADPPEDASDPSGAPDDGAAESPETAEPGSTPHEAAPDVDPEAAPPAGPGAEDGPGVDAGADPPVPDGEEASADDAPTDRDTSLADPASSTVTVESGESFWTIAEDRAAASGDDSIEAVTSIWVDLVQANGDRLVEPGNPDLILPGQVLVLPALGTG